MRTIGIIGTAGRRDDFDKMNVVVFNRMKQQAQLIIENLSCRWFTPIALIRLVSGGAAWADHVAVSLFLDKRVGGLILHLPHVYDMKKCQYEDALDGSISNYHHRRFGAKCYMREAAPLKEICSAIQAGADYSESDGFLSRDALIARDADALVAFTFGKEACVKRGGTHHTMQLFLQNKEKSSDYSYHFSLNDNKLYNPAKICL